MDREEIKTIIRMIKERYDYWTQTYKSYLKDGEKNFLTTGAAIGSATAYETCANFLELALDENWEALGQFDYYGKE